MKSIAHQQRNALEEQGEYVVLANTAWFAIFLNTWHRRNERAKSLGRSGSNLVIYKTQSDDPRDHTLVPHSVIHELLRPETMTTSEVNGSQRWNLTLKDRQLRVSYQKGKVDVSQFHRSALIIESAESLNSLAEATSDEIELAERVRRLRRLPELPRPNGTQRPPKVATGSRTVYERRPDVKAWVLREAKGVCELCGSPAPFLDFDGQPFLELHHVRQLAHSGPDTVENAVALCPNCHRRAHLGADRDVLTTQLYRRVQRLVRG